MSEFASLLKHLKFGLRPADEPVSVATGIRQAAVALILRQHLDEPQLLVIKRAESERDHWSGHLALPGGRRQAEDPNLCFTALRETREEVGIDLSGGGEVLGRLETVTPQSSLAPQVTVTPFVAVAPPEYHLRAAGREPRSPVLNHEVASAFWIPTAFLNRSGRSEVFRLVIAGRQREWPAYPSEQGLIWGLTERILTGFLELIKSA
ncbi:MAG TPA: CoA pyrophosphatase [Pyrinomonadaceae bacterium]|jgi:8-oxo-dGTP pyrophosphatase MutT (NUDIX family)